MELIWKMYYFLVFGISVSKFQYFSPSEYVAFAQELFLMTYVMLYLNIYRYDDMMLFH